MMVVFSTLMSFAQAASDSTSKCLALDSSNICGEAYVGLPVLLPAYKSVADFNQKLARVALNEDLFGAEFETYFGCSKNSVSPLISSVRFRLSFWCSREVSEAVRYGCSDNGKAFRLCPEECTASVTTTKAILDSQACSMGNSTQIQNGKGLINVMNALCSKSDNSKCTTGAGLELQFCGFPTAQAAKAECVKPSSASILCCQQYRSA